MEKPRKVKMFFIISGVRRFKTLLYLDTKLLYIYRNYEFMKVSVRRRG